MNNKVIALVKKLGKYWSSTFVKYVFSYLIILVILMFGFLIIIKKEVVEQNLYYEKCRVEESADRCIKQFDEYFQYLIQINETVQSDIDVVKMRYQENSSSYFMWKELKKFDKASALINSIIYYNEGEVVSTNIPVRYQDGTFQFYKSEKSLILLDITPYLGSKKSQLIVAENDISRLLLYLPPVNVKSEEIFIYILEEDEFTKELYNLVTVDSPSAVLFNSQGKVMGEINGEALLSDIDIITLQKGFYERNGFETLYVHNGSSNGLTLITMLKMDQRNERINDILMHTYATLVSLGGIACILLVVALRMTYYPLLGLARKYKYGDSLNRNCIQQLEFIIMQSKKHVQQMDDKLKEYHDFMQEALLETLSFDLIDVEWSEESNMNDFLKFNLKTKIFIIYLQRSDSPTDCSEYFMNGISERDSCIIRGKDKENIIFLINTIKDEQEMQGALTDILCQINEKMGCKSVIAFTKSFVDIPFLCQKVKKASGLWAENKEVIDCNSCEYKFDEIEYPHELMDELSKSLKLADFSAARIWINKLFLVLDFHCNNNNKLSCYFIQCVLIDMLSVLGSSINQSGIKFECYSDLYYETLYLSRSCSYSEVKDNIKKNFQQMFCVYEQEYFKQISFEQLKKVVEKNYCNADFSIQMLADYFGVSVSHMSNLFRKEVKRSFSDYLWELRFEKAKELLIGSDMTIDEIGCFVGYGNTYSFRRKFKQHINMTPAQYRTLYSGNGLSD